MATFAATSTTSASQPVVTQDDIRAKIIEKLHCLVQLQQELQFLASQCRQFSPPGVSPLPSPPQLLEENDDGDNDRVKNNKSKLKLIKLKEQYERELGKRCMDALRPLGSTVCLALGFPELSIANQQQHLKTTKTPHSSQESMLLSLGASQLKSFKVGSPTVNLLLSHLHQTLSRTLENDKKRKMSAFFCKKNNNQLSRDDDNDPNPYTLPNLTANERSNSKLHSIIDQQSKGQTILNFLELCIKGNIFPALHEYLATIAEIYGGMREAKTDDEDDIKKDDNDGAMKECTCLLFQCVSVIVSCEHLMISSKGQVFLNVIVNQLSNGGDSNHDAIKELRNKRVVSSRSLFQHLSHLFELIQEIVTTRETSSFTNENDNMDTDEDNLRLIMYGINCLNSILVCINKSIDSNDEDCNKSVQSMKKSFSNSCHQLLQRQWNTDTKKYTKSNVGTLLSLYLEHYPNPYSPVDNTNFNVLNFGRMGALINVIRNVLAEIPNTIKCKGPLPTYPTCCDKTFPFYYFNAFSYLVKEIHSLFHMSSQQQLQLSVGQKLDVLEEQVRLLDTLSLLTKENSHLAKSPILLIQCKGGIAFLEKFITLAVPFLEIHFKQKQTAILSIINHLQQSTRQLTSILSYAKRERDIRFNKEAPKAKKILETFIHKIKSLMRKNKVLEAFWGGNLKQKNIDGSLIADKNDDDDKQSEGSDDDNDESEEEDDDEGEGEEENDETVGSNDKSDDDETEWDG